MRGNVIDIHTRQPIAGPTPEPPTPGVVQVLQDVRDLIADAHNHTRHPQALRDLAVADAQLAGIGDVLLAGTGRSLPVGLSDAIAAQQDEDAQDG